ncbi:unnamed protein product [Blepharisma stoltei]|uniref:Uncharacterized protein n=1 Tax=Blepharisma stoltei TaxID=1481888 RepID=A0AAU9JCC9_9CILI|nr:unnamed protein product [Blepharisma stoltei]
MGLTFKESLVIASTLYIVTVYNLNQGYIKNKHYIDPFFKKPSFGRYSEALCEDAIKIEHEMTRNYEKVSSKYQKQGLALTRNMYLTAGSNLNSTKGESNPNIQTRLRNRMESLEQ